MTSGHLDLDVFLFHFSVQSGNVDQRVVQRKGHFTQRVSSRLNNVPPDMSML